MNGKKSHLNGVNKDLKNRPEYLRSGSRDNVRKIVEKEGKIARNLVAWSVPSEIDQRPPQRERGRPKKRTQNLNRNVTSGGGSGGGKKSNVNYNNNNSSSSKVTTNKFPNNQQKSPSKQPSTIKEKKLEHHDHQQQQQEFNPERNKAFESKNQVVEEEPVIADSKSSADRETKSEQYQERIRIAIEKGSEETKPSQRPISAASFASQKNLRARYWSYLFDNFHRAVDEIYLTCENDESVLECKEVIMMLEVCKKDFLGLIHKLELFNQLETSDVRPQSLAWEVRKQMSPGKCSPTVSSRRSPSPAAARFLNFSQQNLASFSWADRVRGFSSQPSNCKEPKDISIPVSNPPKPTFPSPVHEVSLEEHVDDDGDGGWEVVKKGRSRSKGSNLSTSSGSSLQNHKKHVTNGNNNTNTPIQEPANTEDVQQNKTEKPVAAYDTGLLTKSQMKNNIKNDDNNKESEKVTSNKDELSSREKSSPEQATAIGNILLDLKGKNEPEPEKTSNSSNEKGNAPIKIENLSRSSTIIEEYLDYNNVTDEVAESLMKSTSSFNMETIDLAFNLTEDELQIKEEQEKALASAIAEEETLTKELEEEALKDDDQEDDISSDRDYTISDGQETPKDLSDELPLDCSTSFDESDRALTWEEMCQQYDKEHEQGVALDWGDMMELSESIRMPGRALEMHQKLSSPSRRKSRSESVKRSEERMARAERRRLRFLVEKCERLRILSERVRKVRELKNKLIQEKEQSMLDQMKRAEINRKIMLQEKVKKAQEEELKVNEIAFINSLEAQNKRIEVQEKHQISEARLQDLMEERQRRKEDKQAKEEAAQERRRQLEQERLARLQEIKQKRGNQAAKWQKERIEREKAREELAKERQRNREMKVAARDEALQQATEELQKRIEQKHIESTRRHEQKLTEVKEKSRAASSSRHSTVEETPSAIPYEKLKKCTLCDIEIVSDVYMVSHLKGNKHKNAVKETNKKITDAEMEAFSAKYIKEVDANNVKKQKQKDEQEKLYKKKSKKLRSRMTSKGKEFESDFLSTMTFVESSKRGRLQKAIKEMTKLLQGHTNGAWPAKKVSTLDKALSEITRTVEAGESIDKKMFCQLGGVATLCRVLLLFDVSNVEKNIHKMMVPPKLLRHTVDTIAVVCKGCIDNSHYLLLSNKLAILIDILAFIFKSPLDINSSTTTPQKDKNDNMNQSASSIHIVESRGYHMLRDYAESQLVISLMKTVKLVLSAFCPKWPPPMKEKKNEQLDLQQRVHDIVSYMVCERIFEKLVEIYRSIQGPLDDNELSHNLKEYVEFLQPLAFGIARLDLIFAPKRDELVLFSQLMIRTELCGLVALMYSLLHQGSTTRIAPSPLPLAESTIAILVSVFKTLNTLALVDLMSFQKALAGEGTSLQYRSVTTYLLRYVSNEKSDDLLHEVILNIGYFSAMNEENQIFIQTGRAPSLIQQLCMLPFGYFSDLRLKDILFPTLISACFKNQENKEMLAQDVNPSILSLYLEEKLKDTAKQSKTINSIEQRSELLLRFPKTMLEEGQHYFAEEKSPVKENDKVNDQTTLGELENRQQSEEFGVNKNMTLPIDGEQPCDDVDLLQKHLKTEDISETATGDANGSTKIQEESTNTINGIGDKDTLPVQDIS